MSKVCSGCGETITGKFLQVGGKEFYHPNHFVCSVCSTSLASGKPAVKREGKLVCADCVPGAQCHRCKKKCEVGQKVTQVKELSFHEECLRCGELGCGKPIPKKELYLSAKNKTLDIFCKDHTYV